jgi:hypothetical protein
VRHSAVLDDIALPLGNFNENENNSIQVQLFFVFLIVILVLAASLKVYVVRDEPLAKLFWRGDESHLFLGTSHTGYRVSYLGYLF